MAPHTLQRWAGAYQWIANGAMIASSPPPIPASTFGRLSSLSYHRAPEPAGIIRNSALIPHMKAENEGKKRMVMNVSARAGIRTPDLQLRRLLPYPC